MRGFAAAKYKFYKLVDGADNSSPLLNQETTRPAVDAQSVELRCEPACMVPMPLTEFVHDK
jgi:hypothetical protein